MLVNTKARRTWIKEYHWPPTFNLNRVLHHRSWVLPNCRDSVNQKRVFLEGKSLNKVGKIHDIFEVNTRLIYLGLC
jgi:hypothetical protein